MKKREADFGLRFRSWVKSMDLTSAAFELKQTPGLSLPFNALQEHQEYALVAAKTKGILYKAPDDSRGVKPFDYFYIKSGLAFVVIQYKVGAVAIDIDKFVAERERSLRKSLTYSRATEIATYSF